MIKKKQIDKIREIAERDFEPTWGFVASEQKTFDERMKDAELEEKLQDIKSKKETLNRLFIFLVAETIIIFIFTFFQATKIFRFHLEEWSFKLLVAATISQITYMLQFAVKHLFPKH